MCYGFVYIWMDTLKKRYYIGSHYGAPSDSYICSNKWMISAYKKRPFSFKRRILWKLAVQDKKALLKEEQRWLDMIKDRELATSSSVTARKNRYYNMKKHAAGGNGSANLGKSKPRRDDKAFTWEVISPDGEKTVITRLYYFCNLNGISKDSLYSSYTSGRPLKQGKYKGWQLILLQSSTTKAPNSLRS